MAFILKDSPECVKSELELFNLPGTQTVIQDGQWKQFHPLSNVFDNAPVEFHISGSAEDYIDLSQTQLYVKAKIVKVDNTPITKDDTIGPTARGGRVRSTTPAEDRYIVLSAKRNRRTTAQQVANQFLAASGKQISRKTVARRLRGGGLYARRPVVCVPLTRQHRTARLQ
ncbi:uncharacterized protein TNCV_319271 [Trichonephila clavipes]|nr:uncharacterized protein TNCV_319271 [Trichonephila clavipes]